MRRALLIAAPWAALLGACSSGAPLASLPGAPAPPPPMRPPLAAEQRRLAALFDGTPVRLTMQGDSALQASVPLRYCFDHAGARVKPPLAAVLDRLAKSQAGAASTFRVTAPTDPDARGPALARDRALATRDYLVAHGIAPVRIQAVGSAQTDGIEIVVAEASPA